MSAPQAGSDMEREIREVLETRFGRETLSISLAPRSNNSKVYTISVGAADPEKNTSGEQPLQPGVEQMPSSTEELVFRFTNPGAALNDAVVVQSEVASLWLARDALASLDTQIVPRVYGWKAAAANKPGWILMEFLSGGVVSPQAWERMNAATKKDILGQIAQTFKLIQDYKLPSSVKGYGGLGFADDGSIVVGPTPIHGATSACGTYHELYTQYLHTQLAFMDKCDIVAGWKDTDLRSRIDVFVAKGFGPLLKEASSPDPPQTLVHGDFDFQNLLFDLETRRLVGLLDFSFSHIASAADEYFYSFPAISGLLVPLGVDDGLRHCLLHGFDAKTRKNRGRKVAVLKDEAFELAGVQRPVDLMPGIETLSELYWFIQNLSPGILFMPRVRATMAPERANAIRSQAAKELRRALDRWGY